MATLRSTQKFELAADHAFKDRLCTWTLFAAIASCAQRTTSGCVGTVQQRIYKYGLGGGPGR